MRSSVLVIDDERGIADALAIRLRAAGFEVRTAASGARGLESARESRPDAIVLDVRMPELDGFELHALLKREPSLVGVPVVFLSANVQDSERQRALDLRVRFGRRVLLAPGHGAKADVGHFETAGAESSPFHAGVLEA